MRGGTYFFTVVTCNRRKILTEPENVSLLRQIFQEVIDNHPFTIEAIVLLPDHLHCIWTLPDGDHDFSTRWRLIKGMFSRKCDPRFKGMVSAARRRKNEQSIWQHRFWEHLIRDHKDLINHVEYIHYNPVKHGLVTAPVRWPYSSFHRYVEQGIYSKDWGACDRLQFPDFVGKE